MIRSMCFFLSCFIITSSIAQPVKKLSYPLVIEFYSIGTGVPDNKPLYDYIKDFKKQQHLKTVSFDRIGPLGREGEYDLCFRLEELSKKQKVLFIQNIKRIVAGIKGRGEARCKENFNFQRSISNDMINKEVL